MPSVTTSGRTTPTSSSASTTNRRRQDSGLSDIDAFLTDISEIIRSYRLLLRDAEDEDTREKKRWFKTTGTGKASDAPGGNEAEAVAKLALAKREQLKKSFIAKKQAVRAVLALESAATKKRTSQGLGLRDDAIEARTRGIARAEVALLSLQDDFRDIDAAFKSTAMGAQRRVLGLDAARGVAHARDYTHDGVVPVHMHTSDVDRKVGGRLDGMTNDEALGAARQVNARTAARLAEGLAVVNATRSVAADTAITLQGQREQLQRVDTGLDGLQSETALARTLLSSFMKRMYTDRLIMSMAGLLVLTIVGIVVYAAVEPSQTVFNVPDEVQPPLAGVRM